MSGESSLVYTKLENCIIDEALGFHDNITPWARGANRLRDATNIAFCFFFLVFMILR